MAATIDHPSILAIVQLILFAPTLFLALWVCTRHGFHRRRGWIFVAIFSVLRISGAACQLATIGRDNLSLAATAVALSSIGLSPLLFAMIGLLKRTHDQSSTFQLPGRAFLLFLIPILISAVLAGVGASYVFSQDPATVNTGVSLLKAESLLFFLTFVAVCTLIAVTYFKAHLPDPRERYILLALVASVPLLTVRFVWGLLVGFDHDDPAFSPVSYNVIIQAFMAIGEEWVTIVLYLTAGLLAPRLPSKRATDGENQEPGKAPPS
ncbi:MAG: hypothetical protein M1838_000135 [Thelocarpon superellum]|nr:MAG: hypothetical protein M1838_000135 [Thelocarpon superellum]